MLDKNELELQKEGDRLVNQNVYLHVSSLIDNLRTLENGHEALGLDEEEFAGLYYKHCTAYVAADGTEFEEEDEAEEYCEENGKHLCDDCEEELDEEHDNQKTCPHCEEETFSHFEPMEYEEEDRDKDPSSHYVVSSYLANHLEAMGEIVQDTNIGHIYGRVGGGQSMSIDHEFRVLAKENLTAREEWEAA